MAQADVDAAVVRGADQDRARARTGLLRFIPGFVYILGLYIIGKSAFPNPRAPLFDVLGYQVSWVEILLLGAAVVAMAEQVKVARPGVNNTTEVLLMGAIAIIQLLLFALGAAKVDALRMFDNTEFLILTVI